MECWKDRRNQAPLTQKQIWAIRFFLDRERRVRDRALFDFAIDSKLCGCDLVIKTDDLVTGLEIRTRAMVIQQKTGRPVQSELTRGVRASLLTWLKRRAGSVGDYAFPSRVDHDHHMSARQYARLVLSASQPSAFDHQSALLAMGLPEMEKLSEPGRA